MNCASCIYTSSVSLRLPPSPQGEGMTQTDPGVGVPVTEKPGRCDPARKPLAKRAHSSSQAPYLSLPRKRASSLTPLLLLSAKDRARLTCSVTRQIAVAPITTVRCRYHSFAVGVTRGAIAAECDISAIKDMVAPKVLYAIHAATINSKNTQPAGRCRNKTNHEHTLNQDTGGF